MQRSGCEKRHSPVRKNTSSTSRAPSFTMINTTSQSSEKYNAGEKQTVGKKRRKMMNIYPGGINDGKRPLPASGPDVPLLARKHTRGSI